MRKNQGYINKADWIKSVGELSAQLRESTDYWKIKVNKLISEIYHTHLTSTERGNDLAKAVKPRGKFCFALFSFLILLVFGF